MRKVLFLLLLSATMMVSANGEMPSDTLGWLKHPWAGKRVGYIGDSITDPNNYKGEITKYWSFLEEWLNITPLVSARSGYRWSHVPELADKLYNQCGQNVDAILVFLGTNDYNGDIPIGEWYTEREEEVMRAKGKETKHLVKRIKRTLVMDESTFKGRINIGMQKLKSTWPDKQIILMTPLHRSTAEFSATNYQPDESYQNECGEYIDAYVNAVKEAGNVWGVPVLDLNAISGMNPMVEEQLDYYHDKSYDRLHPSTKGQIRIAKTLMYQLLMYPVDMK